MSSRNRNASQAPRTVARVTIPTRATPDGEWVVKAWDQNGRRFPEADYFAADRADAIATAAVMARTEQGPIVAND